VVLKIPFYVSRAYLYSQTVTRNSYNMASTKSATESSAKEYVLFLFSHPYDIIPCNCCAVGLLCLHLPYKVPPHKTLTVYCRARFPPDPLSPVKGPPHPPPKQRPKEGPKQIRPTVGATTPTHRHRQPALLPLPMRRRVTAIQSTDMKRTRPTPIQSIPIAPRRKARKLIPAKRRSVWKASMPSSMLSD
jgi:hypothetical protein